jgi:choline transport protein
MMSLVSQQRSSYIAWPFAKYIQVGLTLIGFFVVVITCVSRATTKQTSEFVWTYFTNASGWTSGGVVFMTGLISPNYMYAGIDGAIHLAEECANPEFAVPRALLSTWIIGFITSFTFAVAMTYSISDFSAAIASVTG